MHLLATPFLAVGALAVLALGAAAVGGHPRRRGRRNFGIPTRRGS